MAGVNLLTTLHFSLGFFFLISTYFFKFLSVKYFVALKTFKSNALSQEVLLAQRGQLYTFFLIQLLLILTFKINTSFPNVYYMGTVLFFFAFTLFSFFIIVYLDKVKKTLQESEVLLGTIVWLVVAISSFFFVKDLLLFLLALETIATIYYFFFLGYLESRVMTLIKFKNLLSNYLWVAFFTLIFYFMALLLLAKYTGTLSFAQVFTSSFLVPGYVWQMLLIAFLWKLGTPGFYFFKLELYQYLPLVSLIFFSLSSVYVNTFLLFFFFATNWCAYVNFSACLLMYLMVTNIVLIIRCLKTTSFYHFLGLSAINTWNTVLVLLLVTFMIFLPTKFYYTTEGLAKLREDTAKKVCYRPALDFLKLKTTLTNSLSNRLVKRGNYRGSYLLLRRYYVNVLRANFTYDIAPKLIPYLLTSFDNKDFLLAYSQYQAMKNFDYALNWRGSQNNSLFNMITTRKKKKKKFIYTHRIFFIKENKRLLFVWRWLAVIIKTTSVGDIRTKYNLIRSLENFMMAPVDSQVLHDFKLQIYRLQLLRTI